MCVARFRRHKIDCKLREAYALAQEKLGRLATVWREYVRGAGLGY